MPFFETIKTLFTNIGHSSPAAFVGVGCILVYFSWIMYRAVKQIRVFANEDHH